MDKIKILVAEDNPIVTRLMKLVLEKNGHTVAIAMNGLDALEFIEKDSFDLVFMDIQMPGLSGIETTTKIRNGDAGNDNKDLCIIGLTAHEEANVIDEAIAAGMYTCFSKPIDVARFNTDLKRIFHECNTLKKRV